MRRAERFSMVSFWARFSPGAMVGLERTGEMVRPAFEVLEGVDIWPSALARFGKKSVLQKIERAAKSVSLYDLRIGANNRADRA